MDHLAYNRFYGSLVRLWADDTVWEGTTVVKDQEHLQQREVVRKFKEGTSGHPKAKHLLENQLFAVEGTLIQACPSAKAPEPTDHVAAPRGTNLTPNVAQNDTPPKPAKHGKGAIEGCTRRHLGRRIAQSCRAMSECISGWGEQRGTMRKTKHQGIARVGVDFV